MTKKKSCKKTLKILKKNSWQVSTGVLAILLIATFLTGGLTGAVVSPEKAGANVLAFAIDQGANAEFVSASDDGSLYQVVLSIDGQEVPVFVTKDGQTLVPQPIPLTTPKIEASAQTEAPAASYSEEDLVKLKEFSDCLGEKGIVIYGADWCGWTKKLAVDTLGGFETASAAYVECTKEEELCSSEGITGYPTVKMNGEIYEGARTIEALSQTTGCPAPSLTGSAPVASDTDASC